MWVKFERIVKNKPVIFLPLCYRRGLNGTAPVSLGKKTVYAEVAASGDLTDSEENSFDNPFKIRLTDALASRLELKESLTYQLKFIHNKIKIGPVIGLLMGNHSYLYDSEHMKKYSDRFGVYNRIGGLIYAFSSKTIDWESQLVYGLYYDYPDSAWKFGRFPLPSVIYRRDFNTDNKTIRKLLALTDGKIFNSFRFSKFDLYNYVKKDAELYKYLPLTELSAEYETTAEFIKKNGNIILKPTDLSRGRGICIITRESDGGSYRIFDYRNDGNQKIETTDEKDLKNFFIANKDLFINYVVQKHLPLAKIDGSAFDIRVVMQKEKPSEWKCTGIECRVAPKGMLLTNISRGGYALTLDEALEKVQPGAKSEQQQLKAGIDELCNKLCKYMDKMGPHFAEFGMDIALDENGSLWLIEINVFPSFKGFKVIDNDTYRDIRYTPMIYAASLDGF